MLSLLGVGALVAALHAGAATAQREIDTQFASAALRDRLHFEVYLPAGYASGTRRYPVVYFLHGLPAGGGDYRSVGFVSRALDRLARRAILVAPQGARAGEPDPEYLDRGPGRNWETAIATELPRVVDSRYRTIPSRRGRAIVGLSAGGYGAMHLALRHLATFSVVESWSGYFHPTNPAGTAPLDLGSAGGNAAANVHRQTPRERRLLRRLPTFIAFYVGRSDARFAAENETMNHELTAAAVPHVFRLYEGGHGQALWQRHAEAWLGLALAHLAPVR